MKASLALAACFLAATASAQTPGVQGARTMKNLVAHYSLTGKTHVVAQMLARELGADVRRVEEVEKHEVTFWFIFKNGFAARRGVESEIKPIDTSFQGYDRVFVGSPVWGWSPSTPINAFIARADFTGKEVVLFMTMGSNDAAGAIKKMGERVERKGGKIVGSFAFSAGKATEDELAARTREAAQRYR